MNAGLPIELTAESDLPARRPLRIACVTETYPPEVNGVSLTVARMVGGLHRRQHAIQLLRPRQVANEPAECVGRFEEVLLGGLPVPGYSGVRMGVPCTHALRRLWMQQRPDVVHIATEGPLGWSALQAATKLSLPVCSDFRTNFHTYSRMYGIGWLHRPIMAYLRHFHNQTACTMVPTDDLRRELALSGFERLAVVSRGVDSQQFSPAHRSTALRASWGAADDSLVVCCVGRLAREKNLDLLITTFKAIAHAVPGAQLVLVGSGPLQHALQQQLPSVCFAGQRRGADLAAHYASADLFVFPSLSETFGNVTAEALASGLPVVAFDHAAAAQLITHGEQGLRVACDDAQGFVNAAVALAADADRRRRFAQAARARALALDWDSVVLRFEAVLAAVVHNATQSGRRTTAVVGARAA